MQSMFPPVIADGRIHRVLKPVRAFCEVQVWRDGAWHSADVPLTRVARAPEASGAQLSAERVPLFDR